MNREPGWYWVLFQNSSYWMVAFMDEDGNCENHVTWSHFDQLHVLGPKIEVPEESEK